MTIELLGKVFFQHIRNQLPKSESTVKLKPKMSSSTVDRVKFIQDFQTEVWILQQGLKPPRHNKGAYKLIYAQELKVHQNVTKCQFRNSRYADSATYPVVLATVSVLYGLGCLSESLGRLEGMVSSSISAGLKIIQLTRLPIWHQQ